MRKYDMYWSSNPDWFEYDDDLFPVLTDNAPEDAKESFKNYLAQKGYTDKLDELHITEGRNEKCLNRG